MFPSTITTIFSTLMGKAEAGIGKLNLRDRNRLSILEGYHVIVVLSECCNIGETATSVTIAQGELLGVEVVAGVFDAAGIGFGIAEDGVGVG